MSSPSIPARMFCYAFGFIMTCDTFAFVIPGSFWQLPKLLVIIGFFAMDTLWLGWLTKSGFILENKKE